jgi:hypothetical protein
MPFIPVLDNMIKLAGSEVNSTSQTQYTQTTKNTLHPEMGYGESRAIKNESAARSEEAKTLVEKSVGIPMYHGLIEMFKAALTPLATPLGIPGFVVKLICQQLVDSIFGKPNMQLTPPFATYTSPKMSTPPEPNPYVPDKLGSLPLQSNLEMAKGRVEKGG